MKLLTQILAERAQQPLQCDKLYFQISIMKTGYRFPAHCLYRLHFAVR